MMAKDTPMKGERGKEATSKPTATTVAPEKKFSPWMQVTYRGRKDTRKENLLGNKETSINHERNGPGSKFDPIVEMGDANLDSNDL